MKRSQSVETWRDFGKVDNKFLNSRLRILNIHDS